MRASILAAGGALALLVTGCATPARRPGPAPALAVPFIPQKPGYCGPAALAMVATYYGHRVTQDEIAADIYLPTIHGTLTTELADYARRFHLWVRAYRGSVSDLREKLAAGVPLVVLGRWGVNDHYLVVLRVDNFRQTFTAHSDTRANLELSQEDFFRRWERTDRWTLLVCPPDRARWRLSADEHNDLGVFLEQLGQLGGAEQQLRAAIGLRPDDPWFHFNLGNVRLKQGRYADAATEFARALELDNLNADAMNNLAGAWCELGQNLDRAAQLCRRAADLRPSHRAYYLDTLGSVLLKQGKSPEAVAVFASALAATTDRQRALRTSIEQHLAAAKTAVLR